MVSVMRLVTNIAVKRENHPEAKSFTDASEIARVTCNYSVCSVSDSKTSKELISFPMRLTDDMPDAAVVGSASRFECETSGSNSRFNQPTPTLGRYRLRFAETKKDREAAF